MITVKTSMNIDRERKAGMVDANMAKIDDDDKGALTALLAKFTRGNGGGKLFICFNCGKAAGHAAKDCPLAKKHGPSKCKFCHGPHHSKVHQSHFPDAKKPTDEGDDDEDDVIDKLKGLSKKQLKVVKAHLAGLGPDAKVSRSGSGAGFTGSGRVESGGAAKGDKKPKAAAKAAKADLEGDEFWQEVDEDSDDELASVLSNVSRLSKQMSFYRGVCRHRVASYRQAGDKPTAMAYKTGVRDGDLQDTIDVILDSGSDGHILPVSVMVDVKETKQGTFCGGMGDGRELLTHVGYVKLLEGKAYAPSNDKYLISMSMLDKAGCTYVGGKRVLRVYRPNGDLLL